MMVLLLQARKVIGSTKNFFSLSLSLSVVQQQQRNKVVVVAPVLRPPRNCHRKVCFSPLLLLKNLPRSTIQLYQHHDYDQNIKRKKKTERGAGGREGVGLARLLPTSSAAVI